MPQYLDDNGNPIKSQKTYLDPNTGEPINPEAHPKPEPGMLDPHHDWTDPLRGAAAGIKQLVTHPVDSLSQIPSIGATPTPTIYSAPQAQQGAVDAQNRTVADNAANIHAQIQAAKDHPAFTVGQIVGPSLLTHGVARMAPEIPAAMGELPETTGNAIATAKTAASKLVPSLVDGPPESLMTRAVKPGKNNVNWSPDVQKAVPLMKSAEAQLGRPIAGIDDALEAASIAKKGVWRQVQARLSASGKTGATLDGNQIADAMVNSIDKRTALQNPKLVAKVKSIADTYRRPISLNEAEDFLQSANKDLNSYYAKNKVGQQVAMNDPEVSSTVAEADALRKSLYGKLDELAGPGAAQLKKAYGSLTNVEKELAGRKLVADRQAPESLSEQLSTVRGAGKIAKGMLTASPGDVLEGAQNIAVSRALKARNSSDAMIARAFQAAKPAEPFLAPSSPRFAGLLDRGPIQMPAPAEVQYVSSTPPPRVDATTRAQRLGLLLPDKTGGPIELPYVPEMSGGEKLAALMQLLRSKKPIALPAKSTAIQLPPTK